MFKDVLSIGGKPGIYKLISHSKNYIIVESLIDGKRMPSYQNEKVSLLRDIVMYGNTEEKKLNELFKTAFELSKGEKITVDIKNNVALQEYFVQIFPDFDRDRIYPNDIKKFINWYNLLIDNKITDFEIEPESAENADEAKETEKEVKKVEKVEKPKAIVPKSTKKVSTKSAAPKQSTRVAVKKGS